MNHILIIPFGKIEIINEIKNVISTTFNRAVEITSPRDDIIATRRGDQLLADNFLPIISRQVYDFNARGGLGITKVDLFVPGLNYVFGLASRYLQVAVISLARLGDPDRDVFIQRSIKEAVHELGHALFGLPHCQDRSCVMTFANCLADTDFKGAAFCAKCTAKIKSQENPS